VADDGALTQATEDAALQEALAAEHAALWGYGVVGAALPGAARDPAAAAQAAHRDVRDRLAALLDSHGADPVPPRAGYALPSPVRSATDAAALAVTLEEGVEASWVRVLDQAASADTRGFAMDALAAAEVRAVGWRQAAGRDPVTTALPGLPT
jgi:hypothetical protein